MIKPLVSIVLPTFNRSRFLPEAIESCIRQTYQNWELIIVDDCSTDRTPEVIARYVPQDRRIETVRHEINRQLPASLNTGFALARGGLFTWIADDDRFRPEALEVMEAFLEAHPNVDVVYSDRTLIDQDGNILGYAHARPPDEMPYWNATGDFRLYRRKVAETVGGYDEQLFLVEDYDFWLKAWGLHTFHALHRDLYLYRSHSDSLSQARAQDIAEAVKRLLERCLLERDWDKKSRSLAYLRLAREAASIRDRRAASSYLIEAFKEDPRSILHRLALPALIQLTAGPKAFEALKRIFKTTGRR